MTGIKRCSTWVSDPFGSIWHTESFEDADKCVMCVHQIRHSLKEHAIVLAKWPKPKVLIPKPRKEHSGHYPTAEGRAEKMRKQRARDKWRKQVWAEV